MAQSPYLDQNAPEILALERQKKLADLLQSRALEQPQGQMVSGRYVAPSIIQQLAPLANAYMGRQASEDVESKQAKLANLIRGQNVTETKDILETMYGKQGQEVPMVAPSTDADAQPSGFYGNKPSVEMQGGVAPDKMSALLKSLNAQSTGGQSLAPTILAQLNAKPVFHSVAPGASLVQETPSGVKPVFSVPKEITQSELIKNYEYEVKNHGYKGTLLDFEKEIGQARRPITNIDASNKTESEYAKKIGSGTGDQDIALRTAAQKAPMAIQQADQSLKILESGKVFVGKGANAMSTLAAYGDALGIGGKDATEKATNTQRLYANRAGAVLDQIASSGLGSGQGFTDKDLKFLQDAKLGNIEYTKDALINQIRIEKSVQKEFVNRYNQRIKDMPQATSAAGWRPISENVMSEADEIIYRKKKP